MTNYLPKYLWVGKKLFSMGVVTPHKMRVFNKWSKDVLCDGCDELVYQSKEILTNLTELKRQGPNENGQMLPWYRTTWLSQ